MKYAILLFTLLGALCSGCGEAEQSKTPEYPRHGLPVRFQMIPQEVTTIDSRTLELRLESVVKDINFYAVNTKSKKVVHRYITDISKTWMLLPPGNWVIYAIANYGSDLGELDEESLQEQYLTITSSREFDDRECIPMLAKREISVEKGMLPVALPLKRLVARLNLNVYIAPEVKDVIKISSAKIYNIPARLSLTGERTFPERINYTNGQIMGLTNPIIATSYYLSENLAGTVPSIKTPEQRTVENAPEGATSIRVSARNGQSKLMYYNVFPGGNQTSDFNVRANHKYTLNITVCGMNPEDLRVSTNETAIKDSYLECAVGDTVYTEVTLRVTNNTDGYGYSFNYYRATGRPTVIINGDINPPATYVRNIIGKDIELSYRVGVTHAKKETVAVRFSWNGHGYSISQTLTVNFI